MNLEYIKNIIKNKDKLLSLEIDKFKKTQISNYMSAIYIFEGVFLYPILISLISIPFFQNYFIIFITMIFSIIIHFILESININFFFNKIIINHYNKKIEKINIKKESELYNFLKNKCFNENKLIEIKKYYNSLNEYQKNFLIHLDKENKTLKINNNNYEAYIFIKIKEYIDNSNIEEIKQKKEELTDIILDFVNVNHRENILEILKRKLENDREIKRKNILDIFQEEKKETINKKIIQEI